ncbi:hypothetical protein J5277_30660 [Rhizobium sp. 16-449-1b]|uniref:hypothetical protein n=1 Tax=Rhizobium sp. 16-449-1b TaxID=2819989 RepID=UPI001ADC6587|nr:hypothetical protein [Rhizobium sp. 16-449-1b]MBO9198489.1 hypothetical protein [Rhizobium sp. 16-449-1b]
MTRTLLKADAAVFEAGQDCGLRALTFEDPDGNSLQIAGIDFSVTTFIARAFAFN